MFSSKYLAKTFQRLWYSFLSNKLSYKDFPYNSSKDLIACWSFPYCFLCLFYLFMIIPHSTLLPIDNEQVDAVEIGITIKPIPLRDKIIELDVVAIITIVLTDFNIVVKVLYFLYFLFDLLFLSLKYVIISLVLLIKLLKQTRSLVCFCHICSWSTL